MKKLLLLGVAAPLGFVAAAACGAGAGAGVDSSNPADAGMAASDSPADRAPRIDAPIHVSAPCDVVIDAPAFLPALHVPIGTHVDYDSNPPSSGPHYPIWAAYQVWDKPVQREYYVHNLEHGAVTFLYKCTAPSGCPEVVAALKQASDALADDPTCDHATVRVRTVITPDPLLDVPVAAAAWGWTYKAQCTDVPSLVQFAKDHYGQGPEQICGNGATSF